MTLDDFLIWEAEQPGRHGYVGFGRSEGTAVADQTTKDAEYRATPSIRRYVMRSQESNSATVDERIGDGRVGTLVADPAATPALPEIGVELPLAGLYDGLELTAPV